jgi:RimJ/RimL family protein N-acetyltransferase
MLDTVGVPSDFVRVRPVELDDAQAIFDALVESKAELDRWWWPSDGIDHATPEAHRQSVAAQITRREARTAFGFVILDARDDAVLGGCNINFIAWDPGFANLAYWVRTNRHGQGIAPAAIRQVARFGFEELGLHRLQLVIDVDNVASIRAAEKAGAMFEGVQRNRVGHRGAPRPARMYSLVPEDLARW